VLSGRKIAEKTVSLPEVKKIMENVKDRIMDIDPEEGMSHFQEITYNFVNQFAKMSEKDAQKIQKFLMDTYDLEENFAINIINIDPTTVQELRMVIEKSFVGKTLGDEELQEMLYQINELKT
jgi:DNA-directed RNA polymerase subunit F